MSEENQSYFKDENGNFLEVEDWEGIEMTKHGPVKKIEWSIPHVSLYYSICSTKPETKGKVLLEWLPDTVKEVNISNRRLEGELDCTKLPKNLREFHATHNRLNGKFDLPELPGGLVVLGLGGNCFSGTISFDNLPPTMQRLFLWRNDFSGTIHLENLPHTLITLRLDEINSLEILT